METRPVQLIAVHVDPRMRINVVRYEGMDHHPGRDRERKEGEVQPRQ
jgi:hypothetical protein